MKCSLLTLSTFIDGELPSERRDEVDAHLVGCPRCSAGAATLREEKTRVAQLARVTVDSGSAQLMLEQVGIAVDAATDRAPSAPRSPAPLPPADQPWQGGSGSASLPWTPRRPDRPPVADPGSEADDLQPDLPLEGMRAAPASWNRPASTPPAPPWPDSAAPAPPVQGGTATAAGEAGRADEASLDGDAPPPWETDLPPFAEAPPMPPRVWDEPASLPPQAADRSAQSVPAAEPGVAQPTGPPTRLAAVSGPAALWARARDAIGVRLALARGADDLEDSARVFSGTAPPRPVAPAATVADPPAREELPAASANEEELDTAPPARPEEPAETPLHPTPTRAPEAGDAAAVGSAAGWNAFGASSYPAAKPPAPSQPDVEPARRAGRHSRAVARDKVPLTTTVARTAAGAAAAVRGSAATAFARASAAARRAGPDNRLVAGVAAIGLIFVVALLIGHGSSQPRPTTAAHTAASAPAAAIAPHAQSTPASPTAAPSTTAPTLGPSQTYGAGDTGFQVLRLRYGQQTTYLRVVFDLGGPASGTPKVTVSFSSPRTMLVSLFGASATGPVATPSPGHVITAVSLVSTAGGRSEYQFTLSRPATAAAFFLLSPTRFVLDVH